MDWVIVGSSPIVRYYGGDFDPRSRDPSGRARHAPSAGAGNVPRVNRSKSVTSAIWHARAAVPDAEHRFALARASPLRWVPGGVWATTFSNSERSTRRKSVSAIRARTSSPVSPTVDAWASRRGVISSASLRRPRRGRPVRPGARWRSLQPSQLEAVVDERTRLDRRVADILDRLELAGGHRSQARRGSGSGRRARGRWSNTCPHATPGRSARPRRTPRPRPRDPAPCSRGATPHSV